MKPKKKPATACLRPFVHENGFSVMEMTVFLFILSLFLLFSLTYFHKYHKSVLVELTARNIVEGVTLAREYALNERKKCTVSFTENSMSVIKENGDIVRRRYSFPERIEVKEKSEGFNPVVMQPDGTQLLHAPDGMTRCEQFEHFVEQTRGRHVLDQLGHFPNRPFGGRVDVQAHFGR